MTEPTTAELLDRAWASLCGAGAQARIDLDCDDTCECGIHYPIKRALVKVEEAHQKALAWYDRSALKEMERERRWSS